MHGNCKKTSIHFFLKIYRISMIFFSVKFEFVLTQPLIFCSNLGQILTSFCAFTRLSEKSFKIVQDKGKC